MSTAPRASGDDRTTGASATGRGGPAAGTGDDRRDLLARQKDEFKGMKVGACFFGWLSATGLAVLLTGLLGAVGASVGNSLGVDPARAASDPASLGLGAAIVLLAIVLVSYLAGGYVAGRMARFSGVRQGVGVWLWALVITVVLAVLALVAGSQFDVGSRVQGLPRLPMSGQSATTAGILLAVAVALVALVGAILGGLLGMRYHRKIDRL